MLTVFETRSKYLKSKINFRYEMKADFNGIDWFWHEIFMFEFV